MRRPPVLLVLAVFLAPLVTAGVPQTALAPDDAWWTRTLLDLDGDRIDDALDPAAPDAAVRVLVAYADTPTARQRAALEAAGATGLKSYRHFPLLAATVVPARIPALAEADGVLLVEKNDAIERLLDRSVPLIGAPQAWKTYDVTGQGITVAVLDDGVFESHPDFDGKVAGHFDAGSSTSDSVPLGLLAPAGEAGHATHVAGTIAGQGGQSAGTYKGVAPGARFANVKVFLGPNRTSSEYVLDGLDWTLDNAKALNIRIASMSLGGRPSDGTDAISRAVNIVVDEGLVVVAAAGNSGPGPSTVASPGAAEKAITVAAVDKQKRIAGFSSRGPTLDGRLKPDIAAPGVQITSTISPASTTASSNLLRQDTKVFYGPLSGTSMAAPHVSGVVALMLEANPDLTPIEVKRMLLVTAQDIDARGIDNNTGYGFVNAIAAVQVASDPDLLNLPQFASLLQTIPDPPEETFLERLSYNLQRGDTNTLAWLGGGALLLLLALIVVGMLVWGRRKVPPGP